MPGLPGKMRCRVFNRLLQDRGIRLAAALAIAVAIPVAILFYFQFKSLADLERASAVLLRQLTQETADRVVRAVGQDLKTPYYNELLRFTPGDVEETDFDRLRPIAEEGLQQYPFIDAFFVWSLKTYVPYHGSVMMFDRASDQKGNLHPRQFRVGTADEQRIATEARKLERYGRAQGVPEVTIDGRLNRLSLRMIYATPSRERIIAMVGFRVDTRRFQREHLPRVVEAELRHLSAPSGFPPLVAAIVDGAGTVIFRSSAVTEASRFEEERPFPFAFIDPDLLTAFSAIGYRPRIEEWRLRVGYGTGTIGEIVRARARLQMGLMIALAVVMTVGLFFVSRAAAREVRVAELKSDFVSAVSHDLKTPLSLIQLFAETLELGRVKTSDRAQEYYRIINSEARKLNRLINNILEFSKIEAGLKRYRLSPADLTEVTSGVLTSLEHQFRQNNFTVTSNLTQGLPLVNMDVEAVSQAVENLLSNAMKYSSDRKEIGVEVTAENGIGYVRVADKGVGIPKRHQRRIFRKFYRIETNNGFGPQGSGLGLAIVDHVMRAHHGSVSVDSEPGRGSTFTLSFPLRGAAEYLEAGWP